MADDSASTVTGATLTTPTYLATVDGSSNKTMQSTPRVNGAIVSATNPMPVYGTLTANATDTAVSTALGAPGDTAWVSGSGSAIALLKKIASAGGSAVSVADGANVAQGAVADAAYTSGSGTVVSVLKGIFAKLSAALAVTQSGTWNVTNVSGTVSLPTGAATAAKQPALGAAGSASTDVITVQGIASGIAQSVAFAAVAGMTGVVSASAEATHVLKASAGSLYRVYAVNLTTTDGFLCILNATSAPADGAITPLDVVPLSANAWALLDLTMAPTAYSTGITAVLTSAATPFTKTTGVITGFIKGAVV